MNLKDQLEKCICGNPVVIKKSINGWFWVCANEGKGYDDENACWWKTEEDQSFFQDLRHEPAKKISREEFIRRAKLSSFQ